MTKRRLKYILLVLIFLGFAALTSADTLYLKNGRSIEGIIKNEDAESIELEVGSGSVKFDKTQVESVIRSSGAEAEAMRQDWERKKKDTERKISQQKEKEEKRPREAGFDKQGNDIIVSALLDKKVEVSLVLDTGASITMITRDVAKKLGLNVDRLKPDMHPQLADGRQVNAKYIIIDSVKVENSEARKVEACILLDQSASIGADGLLGMSFLKRFNFKVDHKAKKLILEKL